MIRALLRGDGTSDVVLLGLDDENLRRMQVDKPVEVNLRRLDPDGPPTDLPDITIVIFHATAEAASELQRLHVHHERGGEQ